MALPKSILELADALRGLPQIGPRQATRLALALVRNDRLRAELAARLAAVDAAASRCERCLRLAETSPCRICADSHRNDALLLVVEEDTDLEQLEGTGAYQGRYFVLGGRFSASRGTATEQGLQLDALTQRLQEDAGTITELIIAANPTIDGDTLALEISPLAKAAGIATSRLGRGLPVGGEVEYADDETLREAITKRS
jgi:recombination protein RecR